MPGIFASHFLLCLLEYILVELFLTTCYRHLPSYPDIEKASLAFDILTSTDFAGTVVSLWIKAVRIFHRLKICTLY